MEKQLFDFADANGLHLVVRRMLDEVGAYYQVHLHGCEVKDGKMCRGVWAASSDLRAAVEGYARKISGRVLVVGSFSADRKEIAVPSFDPC